MQVTYALNLLQYLKVGFCQLPLNINNMKPLFSDDYCNLATTYPISLIPLHLYWNITSINLCTKLLMEQVFLNRCSLNWTIHNVAPKQNLHWKFTKHVIEMVNLIMARRWWHIFHTYLPPFTFILSSWMITPCYRWYITRLMSCL